MAIWTPRNFSSNSVQSYTPASSYQPVKWYDYTQGVPENNPYKVIDRSQQRISAAGQEVPAAKKVGNLLMSALDVLSRPQYAVTNVISNLTDKDQTNNGIGAIGSAAWQGITGARKSSTTDIFSNLGWQNDESKKWYQGGNLARNILGFVGDVALDPTTYLSFGGAAGAKLAGKAGAKVGIKELAEQGAKSIAPDALDKIASAVGKSTKDLTEMAAKHGAADADTVLNIAKLMYRNPEEAHLILDKGLSAVNSKNISDLEDIIKGATGDEAQKLADIVGGKGTKGGQNTMTATGGKLFTSEINKVVSGARKADEAGAMSLTQRLTDLVGSTESVRKYNLARENITKMGLKVNAENIFKATVKPTEVDMIDTLKKAFGIGNDADAMNALDKMMVRAGTDKSTQTLHGKMTQLLKDYGTTKTNIEGLGNELGIAGKLTAAYDKASKSVFLKYGGMDLLDITGAVEHLGVNGKTVKVMDSTGKLVDKVDSAGNPVYKGLMNKMVLGNGIFGDVLGKATRSAIGAVAPVFNGKYIGYNLLKENKAAYNVAKGVSEMVTDYTRRETSLPKKVVEGAMTLFAGNNLLLKHESLQKAAYYYMERGIDEGSQAMWDFISGNTLTPQGLKFMDELEKVNPEAIKRIQELQTEVAKHGVEGLKAVEDAAARTYLFNDAVIKFEQRSGTTFRPREEDGREAENIIFKESKPTAPHKTATKKEKADYAQRLAAYEAALQKQEESYVAHGYERTKPTFAPKPKSEKVSAKFSTYMGSYEHRKFSSTAKQLLDSPDMIPKDNLIMSMAQRQYESLRMAQNKQFADAFEQAFRDKVPGFEDVVSKSPSAKTPSTNMIPMNGTNYYLSDEMYNQFKRIPQFMRDAKEENWWLDIYDAMTNKLKVLQTSANPTFVIRNLIGETMLNTWFAGVNGKSHKVAAEILTDMGDKKSGKALSIVGDTVFVEGKPVIRKNAEGAVEKYFDNPMTGKGNWAQLTQQLQEKDYRNYVTNLLKTEHNIKTFNLGGREYTALDLMREFEERGLGWSGISKGNLSENLQKTLNNEVLNVTGNVVQKGFEAAKNAGDTTETWTRLAHFVDRLEKGWSPEESAADVRKYHVDYRDLSPTERNVFRRIAPYYTYMRKNLPIQLKLLATQPGRMNTIFHLVNDSYSALKQDNGGNEIQTPDYLQNGLALPISVDDDGNVRYLNWNLPLSDLSRVQYGMNELFQDNFFDMLTPFIKGVFEVKTNSRIGMDGAQIERYEGERTDLLPGMEGSPQIGKKLDYALQQLGVVNTVRQAAGSLAGQAQGTEPEYTKPRQTPMLQSVLPVKNQMATQNTEAYAYRDQLLDYIKRLEQQGVDIPTYEALTPSTPTAQSYMRKAGIHKITP